MRTKQEIAADAKALAESLTTGRPTWMLARMIHEFASTDSTPEKTDDIQDLRADVNRLTAERDREHRVAMSYKLDLVGVLLDLDGLAERTGFEVVRLDDQRIEVLRGDLTEFVGNYPEVRGFLLGWEYCTNRARR